VLESRTQSQINEIELKLVHDEPVQLIKNMETVSDVSSDEANDEESQAVPMQGPQPLPKQFDYHAESSEVPIINTNESAMLHQSSKYRPRKKVSKVDSSV